MKPAPYRISHLDGLRGLAALVVVVYHACCAFMPGLIFGAEGHSIPRWQELFAKSPLLFFLNGSFAVYIFFVLSGFVIAASSERSKSPFVASSIARFLRLALPSGASVLLCGAVANSGFTWDADALAIVHHWWLQSYFLTHIPLASIMNDAVGLYFWTGRSMVNIVLWTMQRELIGSLVIIVVFGILPSGWARFAVTTLLLIVISRLTHEPNYYFCFATGMLLFALRDQLQKLPAWSAAIAFVVAILVADRSMNGLMPSSLQYFDYLLTRFGWTLGATLVLFGTLRSEIAATILSSQIPRFLGRISFALYLVHIALLHSLLAYLFVKWGHLGSIEFAVSAIVYAAAVVAFAYLFTLVIDEPAIRLSRLIRRRSTSLAHAGSQATAE